MKKISLLAASVAIALTGCGGSDDSSNNGGTSPSNGVSIRGFDGYFENAVVFVDSNDNGAWDINEAALGLTNAQGELNLGDSKPQGTLALQILSTTKTPQLIDNLNANGFDENLFTTDSDLPDQAVSANVVFRAPNSSDVISPITDLVVIESKDVANDIDGDGTVSEDEAIQAVNKNLNNGVADDTFDPYIDFVEGADADPVLHKTAQILTETKAANPATYDSSASEIAQEADKVVEDIAADDSLKELLEDDSFKPEVPVDGSGTVTPVPSEEITDPDYKTTVNSTVVKEIQKVVANLNLEKGTENGQIHHKIEITELFQDKNVLESQIGELVDSIELNALELKNEFNLEVYLNNPTQDGSRFLYIALPENQEILKAGDAEIELTLPANEALKVNEVEVEFEFTIGAGDASAPEVTSVLSTIESEVDSWKLIEGTVVPSTYKVSYAGLFDSDNVVNVTAKTNLSIAGLTLTNDTNNQELILSGIPTTSSSETDVEFEIWITGSDSTTGLSTQVTVDVPEIADAPLHVLEEKELFFVETPENGETLNYCQTFQLEEGKVYFGDENYSGDLTKSCAPVSSTSSATYTIDGDVVTIYEDGYEPMTLEVKHTSKSNASTRYIIASVEKDSDGHDQYAAFEASTSEQEVEGRINAFSTETWDNISQLTTLFINGEYVDLYITPQMQNQDDSGNDGIADADLFIDNPNGDITCADMQASFDWGFFGEENASFYEGQNCWTDTENGKKYVTLDFDYSSLFEDKTVHRVHLGALTDELPSFNMNIQYVGDSAYD